MMNKIDESLIKSAEDLAGKIGDSFYTRIMRRKHAAEAMEAIGYMEERQVFNGMTLPSDTKR